MKKYTDLLLVFVVVLGLAFCGNAQAANVTWDITPGTVGAGNSSVTGGAGTWNTTNGNWTIDAGANNIAWVNGNNDTAVFGGTAGTVTLGEGITVGGLTFNVATYTVTGNTLTFGTAGIISNSVNATIASALAGSGAITKDGAGTLTLSSTASTFSGGLILNAGTLDTSTDANLGIGGGITVNGAVLWNPRDHAGFTRSITVNEGAVLSFNNGGTTTGALSGNGTLLMTTADGFTFSNTGNTFTGPVIAGYGMTFASLEDSTNTITLGNLTWTGGAKTFALRPIILNYVGSNNGYSIKNNGSGALVIQNLTVADPDSTRVLTLGGSFTAANTLSSSISNGPGTAVIGLTKSGDSSIWALSGTNTYSGATTLEVNAGEAGLLIFQGIQALSPNTSLNQFQGNSNRRAGITKFLDDSGTPASRSGVNLSFGNTENVAKTDNRYWMRVFVGNNSTDNGGTSSSTQTGSTIQLGNMNLSPGAVASTGGGLAVFGANGYKLQIADVNVTLQAAYAGNWNATLNATNNALIVTGNVQQTAGSSGTTTLQLEGTAAGSLISGNIMDSADVTPKTLSVTKLGTGTWTLSGANTYVGPTTISGGLLRVNGSLSTGAVSVAAGFLGGTGTVNGAVSVSGTGGIDLRDGALGALTVNTNLAINGAAGANILYFDLASGAGGTDKIVVTGDVTMATSGAGIITLNKLGASKVDPGTYDLIEVTGTIPAASSFTLATTAAVGSTFSLQLDGGTGKKLQLVVADAAAGTAATSWTGGSDANWSNGGNWTSGAPGYLSDVTFYNAGAGNLNNTMDADFDINSLLFNAGAISAVTINGARMLTLEATNGVGILINTPSSGSPAHRINSSVGLGSNQTWTVNSPASLTVAGSVSDFGLGRSLTKDGAGTLTLSGANTYSGGLVINAGQVNFNQDYHLGDPAGALTLNGATVYLSSGTVYSTRPLVLNSANNIIMLQGNAHWYLGGAVTGTGGILFQLTGNGGVSARLTNLNNTFAGELGLAPSSGGTLTVELASLLDGSGYGNFYFMPATQSSTFLWSANAVSALVLDNRQIEFRGDGTTTATIQNANTSPVNGITINKDLLVTGTGAKTLTLNAASGPVNVFAGAITDGTNGAAISITKSGNGTWALGGTNTYSGKTFNNSSGGTLILQNVQASLPSASVLTTAINNNQTQVTKLLSDTSGTISLGNTLKADGGGSSGTGTMTIFVGNNGADNGGNGVGGTTGSTIVLSALDLRSSLEGGLVDSRMAIEVGVTGADGYKLQIGGVTLAARGTVTNKGAFLKPTSADLTITGTVQQNNGRTATDNVGLQNLTLDGTTTGNLISGSIKDAEDYTAGTNANAMALNLVKSNTSTWTLSGINTHSGSNTISGGTLVLAAGTCLSDTNLLAITGTGKLQLEAGVQEEVGSLVLGSTSQTNGVWGSSTSGATYTDNTYFAGTGRLYVGVSAPGAGTVIMFR